MWTGLAPSGAVPGVLAVSQMLRRSSELPGLDKHHPLPTILVPPSSPRVSYPNPPLYDDSDLTGSVMTLFLNKVILGAAGGPGCQHMNLEHMI